MECPGCKSPCSEGVLFCGRCGYDFTSLELQTDPIKNVVYETLDQRYDDNLIGDLELDDDAMNHEMTLESIDSDVYSKSPSRTAQQTSHPAVKFYSLADYAKTRNETRKYIMRKVEEGFYDANIVKGNVLIAEAPLSYNDIDDFISAENLQSLTGKDENYIAQKISSGVIEARVRKGKLYLSAMAKNELLKPEVLAEKTATNRLKESAWFYNKLYKKYNKKRIAGAALGLMILGCSGLSYYYSTTVKRNVNTAFSSAKHYLEGSNTSGNIEKKNNDSTNKIALVGKPIAD